MASETPPIPANLVFWDYQELERNAVFIRIWFSVSAGGENVGHVSLSIPSLDPITPLKKYPSVNTFHASLWPKRSETIPTAKILSGQIFDHEFLVNHTQDCSKSHENRGPEFECVLYSLNIHAIKAKFEELHERITHWCIVDRSNGDNVFAMSCSGLARDLLIAGGIEALASPRPLTTIAPSPHNIFTLVRDAKTNELNTHIISKQYEDRINRIFNPHVHISNWAAYDAFQLSINTLFERYATLRKNLEDYYAERANIQTRNSQSDENADHPTQSAAASAAAVSTNALSLSPHIAKTPTPLLQPGRSVASKKAFFEAKATAATPANTNTTADETTTAAANSAAAAASSSPPLAPESTSSNAPPRLFGKFK